MFDGELMALVSKSCPEANGSPEFFEWCIRFVQEAKTTRQTIKDLEDKIQKENSAHQRTIKLMNGFIEDERKKCSHVFASDIGLPSVGYDVCEICGFEKHKPK